MVPPEMRYIVFNHSERVRMLVFETDEPHPDTVNEQGSLGEILDSLLKKARDDHDPILGIETAMQYIVEDNGGEVPKFEEIGDDIHAILITGSVYDAHGNDGWIKKLVELIKHNYRVRQANTER